LIKLEKNLEVEMIGLGGQELIIIGILFVILFGIYIFVLVDILKSEFRGYNKIIWILLVLFLPALGTILYLLIGRKQKVQK
jgi:uncharacterized membrane protein YczE